jgi:hypothetical protein
VKVGDTWCVENDTFDENGAYYYFSLPCNSVLSNGAYFA